MENTDCQEGLVKFIENSLYTVPVPPYKVPRWYCFEQLYLQLIQSNSVSFSANTEFVLNVV